MSKCPWGEKLNPDLLMSSWHCAWQRLPSCMNVCEWMNMTSVVKHFERSVDWKTLDSPFRLAFHTFRHWHWYSVRSLKTSWSGLKSHYLCNFLHKWFCISSVSLVPRGRDVTVSPRVRGRERWWGLTGWTGRNSSIVSLLIRRHRNVHLPSNYCFKAGGQKTAPHHVRWNEFTSRTEKWFKDVWVKLYSSTYKNIQYL